MKMLGRKCMRWIRSAMLLAVICIDPVYAQSKPNPLDKVSKVTTLVNYSSTGQAPHGISEERLRTILELRLRTAGLRVLSQDEDRVDPDLNPYMYLEVSTLQTMSRSGDALGWTYSVRLSARLFGVVPINKSRAPIELWANSTMGVSGKDSASAETERVVTEMCESFLNSWLAANPRR